MNQIPVRLAPLNEQRRIVAKLETLLGKVDTCQKRLGKIPVILKRFRQSILAAASSGRLSNDWRAGNNISDWVWGTLSQQNISIQTGPFGSSLHKADYKPNGIPIVNPMHIKDGKIITSREHCVSQSKAKELQKYRLISGDIVLGRRGEMGRAAVVKVPGYLCGTGSMFLKCNTDSLVPDFVCLLLRSPQAVMALQDASVGSTMINLNQHIVNELDFPIVTLKEQGEIVRRVEALFTFADQIEARYTKAKAHVDKITQSILAKTFRGELVLQNPKDEPASVLLGKLRLAREQPPTKQLRTNHQKAQKKITSKRKA
jgi:type I restriction enzyme S subunit